MSTTASAWALSTGETGRPGGEVEGRRVGRFLPSARGGVATCHDCHLAPVCADGGAEPVVCHSLSSRQVLDLGAFEAPALGVLVAGVLKVSQGGPGDGGSVLAFHYPGELLDLAAYRTGGAGIRLSAELPARICVLPVAYLAAGEGHLPEGYHRLLSHFTGGLVQQLVESRARQGQCAEQRLAAALLDIAARLAATAPDVDSVVLPMSRRDLADYLGMSQETISRQFRRLESLGCIRPRGRRITLCDRPRLEALARRCP